MWEIPWRTSYRRYLLYFFCIHIVKFLLLIFYFTVLIFKVFEVEAIRHVVQEIREFFHEEIQPIRTALSFSIYASLDPWAYIESVSSSAVSNQEESCIQSILDYYQVRKRHYCMFLGIATECHIVPAHLWPSHTRGVGLEVMSLTANDINSPRNNLRLNSRLEKAFDHKRITFEYSPLANDTTKFKLRLKIFDPDFRTEEIKFNGSTILAGTLDNTESDYTFEENKEPFRRILAIHTQKTITSAMEKGWIADEANITATRQRALELARLSLEPQVVGLLFPAGV